MNTVRRRSPWIVVTLCVLGAGAAISGSRQAPSDPEGYTLKVFAWLKE